MNPTSARRHGFIAPLSILFLAFSASFVSATQSLSLPEAAAATFRLRAETQKEDSVITGHGTAFAIDLSEFGHPSSRYMLTACHVVRDSSGAICPTLKIEIRSAVRAWWVGCSVIAYDPRLDLALLEANSDLPINAHFASHDPKTGCPLHVIGSPAGIPLKIFDGYTLEKDGFELNSAYVAFFKQGCSGGPVFEAGLHTVIGVAVAGIKKGHGMDPHTCLYVPLDRVKRFVATALPSPRNDVARNIPPRVQNPHGMPLEKSRVLRTAPLPMPDAPIIARSEAGDGDVEYAETARRTAPVRKPTTPAANVEIRAEVLEASSMFLP